MNVRLATLQKVVTSAALALLTSSSLFAQMRPHGSDTPSYIDFELASYSQNETSQTLDITIVREGDFRRSASVDFNLVDGNAEVGGDFKALGGSLVFAPNENRKTITITLLPDEQVEPNEHFYVELSNPGPYTELLRNAVTVVIVDAPVPDPGLVISGGGPGQIKLSWADNGLSYDLERATDSGSQAWEVVPGEAVLEDGEYSLRQSVLGSHYFYRLRADE